MEMDSQRETDKDRDREGDIDAEREKDRKKRHKKRKHSHTNKHRDSEENDAHNALADMNGIHHQGLISPTSSSSHHHHHSGDIIYNNNNTSTSGNSTRSKRHKENHQFSNVLDPIDEPNDVLATLSHMSTIPTLPSLHSHSLGLQSNAHHTRTHPHDSHPSQQQQPHFHSLHDEPAPPSPPHPHTDTRTDQPTHRHSKHKNSHKHKDHRQHKEHTITHDNNNTNNTHTTLHSHSLQSPHHTLSHSRHNAALHHSDMSHHTPPTLTVGQVLNHANNTNAHSTNNNNHNAHSNADSVDNSEQYPDPAKIDKKSGKFSKKERETLRQCIEQYLIQNGINNDEGWTKLCSHARPIELRGAWTTIAQCLPNRKLSSIYNFCTRTFLPQKTGKWDEDELNSLRMLVIEHGRSWSKIGKALGRLPCSCRDKWRILGGKANGELATEYKKGEWTSEEDERLTALVKEFYTSQSSGNGNGEGEGGEEGEPPRKNVFWAVISERMKTRSHGSCRKRYYDYIYPKLKKHERFTKDDIRTLIDSIIQQGAEDISEVQWDKCSAVFSAQRCHYKYNKLVKKVPNYQHNPFVQNVQELKKIHSSSNTDNNANHHDQDQDNDNENDNDNSMNDIGEEPNDHHTNENNEGDFDY